MLRNQTKSILGIAVGLLLGLTLAHHHSATARSPRRDGDPLEEYDFSGDVPIDQFVHQSRSTIYRHGLWTVQHHVELDPFDGEQWSLFGCRFEEINVYYGTRPMWKSDTTYRAYLSAPSFGPHHDTAPRFEIVHDSLGSDENPAEPLAVVDHTGGDAITLKIGAYNGGASDGSSGQLIRLAGTDPASARVDVLWSGSYEQFVDLDDDGIPEIVDTDRCHWYASYLPHKGHWGTVVLEWSAARGAYVVANRWLSEPRFHRKRRGAGDRAGTIEAALKKQRSEVLAAAERARKSKGDSFPSDDRELAVGQLGYALTSLLWMGRVDDAKSLLAEVDLPHFGNFNHTSGQLTKAEWWEQYRAGCRKSRYWEELCAEFPALRRLWPNSDQPGGL